MLQKVRALCVSHKRCLLRNLCSSSAKPETIATNVDAQIRGLSTQGNIEEALSLVYTHSSLSLQTYASLFHACAQKKCLQHGMALHHFMLDKDPTVQNDLFLTNHIINMYCKCGHLVYARYLFDQMPHRNIVSWTALISGYAQSGLIRECFSLFSGLLVHFCPNEFAFASLLSACEEHDIESGMQVHAVALKISLDTNVYVANALITMYSKRSGSSGGYDQTPDDAWTVFKSMEFRNLISWNSMIAGFQLRGLGDKAIRLFAHMYCNGIGFDRATLLSVFSSLNECGAFDDIDIHLRKCFQLHCLTIKSGFISEIEVVTALIKSHANLGGHISDCYRIFLDTSSQQDIVSWTALISVFAERDPEQAFLLFCQLHHQNYLPDWYTFSIALKACAYFVTEQNAMASHSQVIKKGFQKDTVLCNALIHAYARCGSLALSEQVFNEMDCRDLVSWNSMLKSYAIHGQAKDALQLFQRMNICPDSATFVALLSACSHVGLVHEGVKLFNSMSDVHGIVPQLDHYSCMVDLYGRAGKIFEAEELIHKMPMKPDSVIWSSLLGSCRKHGETRLAKLAADKFNELEPKNSLGYVQMSNIYSSGGSFREACLIRKEMRDYKVRKEPGLSWVEIGKQVHEFGSGGQHHPHRGAILRRLEILIGQLKEMGYVPELSLALYDTEVEHKEDQLLHHSEKMALAFAIMNEGSLPCGGNVIKIMKNIRICVDCHNFMKLASYLFQKEIVVRDSNLEEGHNLLESSAMELYGGHCWLVVEFMDVLNLRIRHTSYASIGLKPYPIREIHTCKAIFSDDAPIAAAIGACMFTSLLFPVSASHEDDDADSALTTTDTRLAVMGILSFIPYFNWLSWVFAWLDTGNRRYALYSLVYLAPYLRTNLSLSPEESWLPIASILFCIVHIQLEASIRNGDMQGFKLFRNVADQLSSNNRKKGSKKEKNLPHAQEQSRDIGGWEDSQRPLQSRQPLNEDLDDDDKERSNH
ncbi:Pentatricopeptide repeat-containing protein, partial [Mucuna pruriens]